MTNAAHQGNQPSYTINDPGPGTTLGPFGMNPPTHRFRGTAEPGTIRVVAKVYEAVGDLTIPANPPNTTDPFVGEDTTLSAAGDWEITLPVHTGPSPGKPNLVVAWYEFPPMTNPPSRHATFFKAIQ